MTRPIYFLLLAILAIAALVDEASAVPPEVEAAFRQKYGDVEAEEWEVDSNGFWEVKFRQDDKDARADFDIEGGWIETEISLKEDELPDAIRRAIKLEYPDEELSELEYVDSAVKGKFYDVEFKRPGENFDVEYREDGKPLEMGAEMMIGQLNQPIGSLAKEQTRTENMTPLELLTECGVNLISIFIYAWLIYYRRHHDHKMLFLLLGFNLFLFPIFLLSSTLTAGFGFTIFALLALVRLRSDTFSKTEVAYLLGAVSLTFINAMLPVRLEAISAVVVIVTAYLGDHPRIWRDGYQTAEIRYRIKDTTKMLDQEFLRKQIAEDFEVEVNDIEIGRVDKNEVRLTVMYRDLAERRDERRKQRSRKS